MRHCFLLTVLFTLCMPLALAGQATLTDAGVKSVGSSTAYVATCEKERLLQAGTLADLMAVLKEGLTQEHWEKVKRQYQVSLREKKQYSVAKDQWLPFRIATATCLDLEKAVPLITSAVKRNAAGGKAP